MIKFFLSSLNFDIFPHWSYKILRHSTGTQFTFLNVDRFALVISLLSGSSSHNRCLACRCWIVIQCLGQHKLRQRYLNKRLLLISLVWVRLFTCITVLSLHIVHWFASWLTFTLDTHHFRLLLLLMLTFVSVVLLMTDGLLVVISILFWIANLRWIHRVGTVQTLRLIQKWLLIRN